MVGYTSAGLRPGLVWVAPSARERGFSGRLESRGEDGPLGCGENESSGFVVSCGELWWAFGYCWVRSGLPGCFFLGWEWKNGDILAAKRGQNVLICMVAGALSLVVFVRALA